MFTNGKKENNWKMDEEIKQKRREKIWEPYNR